MKQKLNNKSSTKAEVIGVNDDINQVLWKKYFLNAQGYFNLFCTKFYRPVYLV